MYVKNLPKETVWNGTLRVDGGWGPKNEIREWAATVDGLRLSPVAEVDEKSFDAVFRSQEPENVSTVVKDYYYTLEFTQSALQSVGDYLQTINTPARVINAQFIQKRDERSEEIGDDVYRITFLAEDNDTVLYVTETLAEWEPVFHSEYDEIRMWE